MLRKPCRVLTCFSEGEPNTMRKIRIKMREMDEFGISSSGISVIIEDFLNAGLITTEKKGRVVYIFLTQKGKLVKKGIDTLCGFNDLLMKGGLEKK